MDEVKVTLTAEQAKAVCEVLAWHYDSGHAEVQVCLTALQAVGDAIAASK